MMGVPSGEVSTNDKEKVERLQTGKFVLEMFRDFGFGVYIVQGFTSGAIESTGRKWHCAFYFLVDLFICLFGNSRAERFVRVFKYCVKKIKKRKEKRDL